MLPIHKLTKEARKEMLPRILRAFEIWCRDVFHFVLYPFESEIAYNLLYSMLIEPCDVFVKCARQSGKTETVTLLLRYLLRTYLRLFGSPLMAGIASPKGEQAKTDIDRIKKSIPQMHRWRIEDRENNAQTIRAYVNDVLSAEMYKFSLAEGTQNESKTLNVLVMEEAHKCNDKKRSDELDPMLASTNGVAWHFGVGCVKECDFRRGCAGEIQDAISLVIDVDRIIKERRAAYEATGDERHLNYEKTFLRELKKKGRQNPEIRRNYYLEDMIEISDYISLKSLRRLARAPGEEVSKENLFIGIDWAKKQDRTVITVMNDTYDVVDWLVYAKMSFPDQVELIEADLEARGYTPNVLAVRADSTGVGDAAMDIMIQKSSLPIGDESNVIFSTKSKNQMYSAFDMLLFTEDPEMQFSYPSDHEYTESFEQEITQLVREYKGDGEYLSPHHPEGEEFHDDFPDSTALAVLGATEGTIGDIITPSPPDE